MTVTVQGLCVWPIHCRTGFLTLPPALSPPDTSLTLEPTCNFHERHKSPGDLYSPLLRHKSPASRMTHQTSWILDVAPTMSPPPTPTTPTQPHPARCNPCPTHTTHRSYEGWWCTAVAEYRVWKGEKYINDITYREWVQEMNEVLNRYGRKNHIQHLQSEGLLTYLEERFTVPDTKNFRDSNHRRTAHRLRTRIGKLAACHSERVRHLRRIAQPEWSHRYSSRNVQKAEYDDCITCILEICLAYQVSNPLTH
jgi:hypothetical protein